MNLDDILEKLRNHDLQYGHQEFAWRAFKKLIAERDIWKARAFVMLWRLPDDVVLGDLQKEVERAKDFMCEMGEVDGQAEWLRQELRK